VTIRLKDLKRIVDQAVEEFGEWKPIDISLAGDDTDADVRILDTVDVTLRVEQTDRPDETVLLEFRIDETIRP
jgi:hypothetical protein